MKRTFLILAALAIAALALHAQPYMFTMTNYASGFFGVIRAPTRIALP